MASDQLQRIEDKLDAIHAEQVRQGVILETHERRSTNLEARVTPLEAHTQRWAGAAKLVGVAATVAALAVALVQLAG